MSLVFAPLMILIASALISTLIGYRSIKNRNLIITASFIFALLVNTYFLTISLIGDFKYARIGELVINAASIFISELVLFLGLLGALYSFAYIEERSETWAYYLLYQLFVVMMIGMASSFNILVIYIFLEASSITSAVLVMFSRRKSSILAAYRYLALSLFGGIIIFSGILWQFDLIHSLNLSDLSQINYHEMNVLGTLYMLGLGVKAGLLPFGILWLPPAHSEAPIPIHTLLSAALVQVAAFNIARVLGSIGMINSYIANMLLAIGLASMLAGSIYALLEAFLGSKYTRFHVGPRHIRGIKRVWAFSTISEVGYIALFVGIAGILASQGAGSDEVFALGFGGAMLHMYNHGFAKSQLLFDSGVLIKKSHAEDLQYMGGLSHRLPIMKFSFIIGALSLGLLPGTFGVTTLKELIFSSAASIFTKIAVMLTATISLIACIWVWYCSFFAKQHRQFDDNSKTPLIMILPGLISGILILGFGIFFTLEWIGLISPTTSITHVLRILGETMIRMTPGD